MKLVTVSGRSGSGKTVALRVLEDLGYYCVDNLPVVLLPELLNTLRGKYQQVAVSVDVRNMPAEPEQLLTDLQTIRSEPGIDVTGLYLDATDDKLVQRFSETRRLHPLSRGDMSLDEAIIEESRLLAPLASSADLRIDTSALSIHQLSELICERILGKKEKELILVFESFGFKHGIPNDADYVFDARFLPNPYWIPELKPYSGQDEPVKQYLASQPDVMKYMLQIQNFLCSWLPQLERNNRSYVTVAIGCTGGRHRSVFIAEYLMNRFKQMGKNVRLRHRTIDKVNEKGKH
ncbi:RNase adapter RapZ [Dongshaea marina]|uniref:RNase adapter RapZ n=1 Tax=Dongshaea marina TaxID=2047966 RepID=UPI000D3E9A77|nr:RNase adapter RapZ [Dongshaea marina]